MPTAIALTVAVATWSGMPARPMIPKLAATATTSGTRTKRPPITERNRIEAMTKTATAICRMLMSLLLTSTSLRATGDMTLPPMLISTVSGKCCFAKA
jgi:hypothetical protein